MDFTDCIRNKIREDDELIEDIYSLVQFGSSVRGDYIEGVSDFDFFALIRENPDVSIPKLRNILVNCTHEVREKICITWAFLNHIDDPLNKGHPFKFLTIYLDDFLENHIVIYGNEIEDNFPRYKWEEMITRRAERLQNYVEKIRSDPKMLREVSGEVIRLMASLKGANGARKDEVLSVMVELDDGDASLIFSEYLEGRDGGHSEEFYVDFILSRTEKILSEINSRYIS